MAKDRFTAVAKDASVIPLGPTLISCRNAIAFPRFALGSRSSCGDRICATDFRDICRTASPDPNSSHLHLFPETRPRSRTFLLRTQRRVEHHRNLTPAPLNCTATFLSARSIYGCCSALAHACLGEWHQPRTCRHRVWCSRNWGSPRNDRHWISNWPTRPFRSCNGPWLRPLTGFFDPAGCLCGQVVVRFSWYRSR